MAVKTYTVASASISSSTSSGTATAGNVSTVNSQSNPTSHTDTDDGGYSDKLIKKKYSKSEITKTGSDVFDAIKRVHGLYQRDDIDIYNRRYRFGLFNPYNAISTTREYLFITKPDLNIYARNDSGALTGSMVDYLQTVPYWKDLAKKHDNTIKMLQLSYGGKKDPFNHLLENMCISNLSIPSLDAETIETASNMYGVNFSYRGSSEASNDGFEFDLEFKDNRYLSVYQWFKAYEEYETLKHHGTIGPWTGYISDKVLHDQFAIYKFLVAEDMETIVYYAKFWGVMPKSLPRDVFSSETFDNGLTYSVSFKSAFFEDLDPQIITDFNAISKSYADSLAYDIDVYNDDLHRMDNRPVRAAYVVQDYSANAPGNKVWKLKWKGSDKY